MLETYNLSNLQVPPPPLAVLLMADHRVDPGTKVGDDGPPLCSDIHGAARVIKIPTCTVRLLVMNAAALVDAQTLRQAFPTTRNFIPIAPRSQHLLDSTHSLTTSEEVTVWHPWWMPVKMAYHLDSIPYMLHWIASYGNLEDRAWGTQLSVSTVIHPL